MIVWFQVSMETSLPENKATLEIKFSIFGFMRSIYAFIVSNIG